MYHGIKEKYIMGEDAKTTKIIRTIQEVGVVKIIMQLPEDIINNLYDLESCAKLCRIHCEKLEREKEKYIKHGIFRLLKRRKRRKKIKEIDDKKEQFITFVNFYEMTKILKGKIVRRYAVTNINSKAIFCIKFEKEDDAIIFALIFLRVHPECIYKE